MATLTTYLTIAQAEAGDTTARAQNILERAIKDTYQSIIRFVPELIAPTTTTQTAAIGTAVYTLSYAEIIDLSYKRDGQTAYYQLIPITLEEYYANHQNDADGAPRYYFPTTTGYQITPPPDDAGTLKETVVPVSAELTGSTTSVIPERFTNVIILGALSRWYAYMRLPDADEYNNRFQEALREMGLEYKTQYNMPNPTLYRR